MILAPGLGTAPQIGTSPAPPSRPPYPPLLPHPPHNNFPAVTPFWPGHDRRPRPGTRLQTRYLACPSSRHPYQHSLRTPPSDRKSTRLNSSHLGISYAVFCLKKKKKQTPT